MAEAMATSQADYRTTVGDDDDEVLRKELEEARSVLLENRKNKFCILCREHKPKEIVELSHIYPHSVLKAAKDSHSIGPSGREVGHSKLGYKGYCKSCERMLSDRGEKHFNTVMHKPLIDNINTAIHVKSEYVAGIHHCAMSIWWRCASLTATACDPSENGKKLRKLLEVVRHWLHEPSKDLPNGIHVYFMALHSSNLAALRRVHLESDAIHSYHCVDDCASGMISAI